MAIGTVPLAVRPVAEPGCTADAVRHARGRLTVVPDAAGDGRGRASVLVVDGDEHVERTLRRMDQAAARFMSASQAAGQLLEQRAPDVLVVDLDRSEDEALGLIQCASERAVDFPVVVVSGCGGELRRLRAFSAGADAYVDKPFTPWILAAAIAELRVLDVPGRARIRGQELATALLLIRPAPASRPERPAPQAQETDSWQ